MSGLIPLEIVACELNPHAPTRADSFDLHLNRATTEFEREALPGILSNFARAEIKGPTIVTLWEPPIAAVEKGQEKLQQTAGATYV